MKDTIRLDKMLANLGYGTRKEVKDLVKDGAVEIDGKTVGDSGMQVNVEKSLIKVNGQEVRYREYIYIMLNKPQGVISATEDKRERTVIDLLKEAERAFKPAPVGRLDKDTEGFLLLTNDGQLAHQLLSPKKHIPKTYYADIRGRVTEEDALAFERGVVLDDGYKTMPAELEILSRGEQSSIHITIYEGKFHQVKRMFKAVGKEVVYLKRISMGQLKLDEGLELGEYRELTDEELSILKR